MAKGLTIAIGKKPGERDEGEDAEEGMGEGRRSAANDMMRAMRNDDPDLFLQAFDDLMMMGPPPTEEG